MRLALLLSSVLLFASLTTGASAQTSTVPVLRAVVLDSSNPLDRGDALSFVVTFDDGAFVVSQITVGLADSRGVPHVIGTPIQTPQNVTRSILVRGSPDANWPDGNYMLSRVTFADSGGRSITYNRDGSITTTALPTAPARHAVPFATQDFMLVTPLQALGVPFMTSVTVTSGGTLTKGAPVSFAVSYDSGSYAVTSLVVGLLDPVSVTRLVTAAGTPLPSGQINASLATDATWPDGNYVVNTLTFTEAAGRTTTYDRAGIVTITQPGSNDVTTLHFIPLAAQDFKVVSPAGTAPTISWQPNLQTAFVAGQVSFSVVVSGGAPFTYQWKFNGADMVGATDETLTLTKLQSTDAGNYTVTIKNGAGSVTSAAVLLTVLPATPTLTGVPTDAEGFEGAYFTTTFQVTVETVASVSWLVTAGGRIMGSHGTAAIESLGNHTYAVTQEFGPIKATDAGPFQVMGINAAGSTTGAPGRLVVGTVVPNIYKQPVSQTVAESSQVTLSISAIAIGNLLYQWKKDGVNVPGATNSTLGFPSVKLSDAGSYTVTAGTIVTTVTSDAAVLTVTPAATAATIITQPANQAVKSGDKVSLTVVAGGTGPLTYQWSKDGTTISGATGATLTLTSVTTADAGGYAVAVTNTVGTVRSTAATLTVAAAVVAPVITAGPVNQTVVLGNTATFTVTVTGTTPFTYQWYRDNVSLNDETKATLTLASVVPAQNGNYTVAVSNGAGTVRSAAAALVVTSPNFARLINLSLLTDLKAGDSFMMGFVVGGVATTEAAKPLLVRAVGPSLSVFGITDGHTDPRLELVTGSTKVGENDNWADDPSKGSQFAAVGAFGFISPTSKDASLYAPNVAKGNSSVKVSGVGSASGKVLAELYETTPPNDVMLSTPRLINVSVLKAIGQSMTVGFVIGGTGKKSILVRAVGPALTAFGVSDFVVDPSLALFDGAGVKIGSNDNWDPKDATTMTNVGAFPLPAGSKDAAYVAIGLSAGNYTLQVTGAAGGSGTALVEVYDVP